MTEFKIDAALVRQPRITGMDGGLLAAMAVAVAVFCFPVVFGNRHVSFDFGGYNFPLWKFMFDAFRDGSLPVYDRFTYSGVPFLSEIQSGLFYPLNGGLLYLASWWLDDLSLDQVQWINGLHMMICGPGVYVLAQLYGASKLRAFATALLVLFSGCLLGNQQHPGEIAQYAWMPWLLVAIERMFVAASARATAGLAVGIALVITIGYLPVTLVILLAAAVYALSRVVAGSIAQRRLLWGHLGLLAAAGALGVALAVPTWLPLLEFLPVDPAIVVTGPERVQPFATTVFPSILGHFSGSKYVGWNDPTKSYFFAGPGIWLALAAVVLTRGPQARCLQVLLAVVVLFGFGPDWLIHAVETLPVIGVLLRPGMAMFLVFVLPFLLLARQPDGPYLRPLAVGVGWTAGAVILASMAYEGYALDKSIVLVGVAWLASFSILALGAWRGRRLPLDVLLVLCAGGLFGQHTLGPQDLWSRPVLPQFSAGTDFVDGRRDMIAALRADGGPYRVAVDQEMLGGPFNSWWRVWRLDSIGGLEATLDRDYAQYLMDNMAAWRTDRTFGRFRPDSPAFQALNVRFILTASPRTIEHPDWALVFDNYWRIYEYRLFTPRFRVLGDDGAPLAPPVSIVRRSVNGWVVTSEAPGPGYHLVVSERWNKAWQASVNHRAESVRPSADGVNLSIELPAGPSSIRLEYRSRSLPYALVLSGLAAVVVIGILGGRCLQAVGRTKMHGAVFPSHDFHATELMASHL
jgi:hypothetical protein